MLDKTSEKILLTAIKKYDGNMDKDIEIFPSEINVPYKELERACYFLWKNGYCKLLKPSWNSGAPTTILLTYNGLKYFQLKRKEQFRFWIPVIISVIALFRPEITKLISYILNLIAKLG